MLEYMPGKANSVADALSRRSELASSLVSHPKNPWDERIKEGLQHDPTAKALIDHAREGKTR